jgi:hypothetical protein
MEADIVVEQTHVLSKDHLVFKPFATCPEPERQWMASYQNLRQNTPEWLESRTHFKVTASRVGTLLGVDPYQSCAAYMNEILGKPVKHSAFTEAAFKWGRTHESEAVKAVSSMIMGGWHKTGLWPLQPFRDELAASPDRITLDCTWTLEIKCPFTLRLPAYPKPHHVAQLFTTMACVRSIYGLLAYWVPGGLKFWIIRWDATVFRTVIMPRVHWFIETLEEFKQGKCKPIRITCQEKKKYAEIIMRLVLEY